jgi:hypothetical protein
MPTQRPRHLKLRLDHRQNQKNGFFHPITHGIKLLIVFFVEVFRIH